MKNTRKLLKLLPIILLAVTSCTDSQTKSVGLYEVFQTKPSTDLTIGKEYIISFDWDNKDPFEEIEIDTVKITGLKNDYVQWQYKNGQKLSCEIDIFKRIIKENQ